MDAACPRQPPKTVAVEVGPVEAAAAESEEPERGQTRSPGVGKSVNAHDIHAAEPSGQIVRQNVGHFPVKAQKDSNLTRNAHEMPKANTQQMPTDSRSGQTRSPGVGKSVNVSKNAHERTEWFRYEMDFRPRKTGYQVLIRRRLKWSATRHAPTVASCLCLDLTKQMVDKLKAGRFTDAARVALRNGGISDVIVKNLSERIGKGNGKRAADLTEHERSILARIESGLNASRRSGDASAGRRGKRLDFSNRDVSGTSDGEFAEVPNVH